MYKVFATRKEPRGVKNTPDENWQYLRSLTSDFDEIFTVSSQMNPTYNHVKYLSWHVRWLHKSRSSQSHTWKKMTWPVLLIRSSKKFEFIIVFMFSRVRNPFLTLFLSYHVWLTSKIQVNFRYRKYLKVLMIVSYRFLKFLHFLCFWGQGIHSLHSYWATMFGWPRKSRSNSGTVGTWRYWWLCLIDFLNFFTIYVFEVKESMPDIPTELPCLSDLEKPGQKIIRLPEPEVGLDFWGYPDMVAQEECH